MNGVQHEVTRLLSEALGFLDESSKHTKSDLDSRLARAEAVGAARWCLARAQQLLAEASV